MENPVDKAIEELAQIQQEMQDLANHAVHLSERVEAVKCSLAENELSAIFAAQRKAQGVE